MADMEFDLPDETVEILQRRADLRGKSLEAHVLDLLIALARESESFERARRLGLEVDGPAGTGK